MATKKLARSGRAQLKRAEIEYDKNDAGETVARVIDGNTRVFVGIVSGSRAFARAVAGAYAHAYDREQQRLQPEIERLEALKRDALARAMRAADTEAARLRGAS